MLCIFCDYGTLCSWPRGAGNCTTNEKPKTESELATFIFLFSFLTATVLSRLIVFASKIVWLNLPWQLIGGAEGPRDSSHSEASSVRDTLPPHFCIIFPANQVKVEILYVSSSFAFVCGSWFTQNDLITIPTQVVGGEKLKKTEKQKHECIKLWKCFKCFSFLSFSRALQSVSWPRAVKNRLDLLTRVANIQLSSTAVAYWLHIKKHLNRREGS